MTYKLWNKPADKLNLIDSVIRKSDGAFIPKDPNNTDYQDYLEWVTAGNTAEAAD